MIADQYNSYCTENIDLLSSFDNKSILITGGTGLIGSTLAKFLLHAKVNFGINTDICIFVRNTEKAFDIFKEQLALLTIINGDICDSDKIVQEYDYVVHAANPTASKFFIEKPAETIITAAAGTNALLQYAKEKNISSFVYLSSMEVYGQPQKGQKVDESYLGSFDPLMIRNCYPLSKKICENLCYAYFTEYGVPTKILRLTQTFGPGASYNDRRVFAEFARCAIEKRNIVLKTNGKTERSYLYTLDAVTAILTVLIKGKTCEAYNAANKGTYCSIADMANMIAGTYGIKVEFQPDDIQKYGYAPSLYMNLETEKLQSLGWQPKVSLEEMYHYLIIEMENEIRTIKS